MQQKCWWSRDLSQKYKNPNKNSILSPIINFYTWIMVYSTVEHDGVKDETLSRKVTVIRNFYQFSLQNRV